MFLFNFPIMLQNMTIFSITILPVIISNYQVHLFVSFFHPYKRHKHFIIHFIERLCLAQIVRANEPKTTILFNKAY